MPEISRNGLHALICMGAVFVLSQTVGLSAPVVPAGPYGQLSAEDFATREGAQEALLKWARNQPGAVNALYQKAATTEDPEQEARCMDILRELVGESFDKDGQGFIGVQMDDVRVAHPEGGGAVAGVMVTHLLKGFPAEKSGLKVNDIILSCNGRKVPDGKRGMEWLPEEIRAIPPDTVVAFEVLRGRELLKFDIRLVRRPTDRELGPFKRSREEVESEQQRAREAHFQRWLRMQEEGG